MRSERLAVPGQLVQLLVLRRKWIYARDAGPLDVGDVPCRQRQAMHSRSRGHQAINDGKRIRHADSPPLFGDSLIDRQDAITVFVNYSSKPHFEHARRPQIAPSDPFDPPADLTYDQNR